MAYNIIFKEQALADATAAYLYHESVRSGLGSRFLDVLKKQYSEIAQNPQLYSFVSADKKKIMRDGKIRRFPYIIFFDIVGRDVIIYSVHDTHKRISPDL